MSERLINLKQKLRELAYLKSTLAILQWDQEVFMPPKGVNLRADTMAHIAGLLHERFVSLDDDKLLTDLKRDSDAGTLPEDAMVIIHEVWREFGRERKLPATFVQELTQLTAQANMAWIEARKATNFQHYAPYLAKIVALKKQEAEYLGYTASPYDALLETYEPAMTTAEVATVLEGVKDFLVPFLAKIKATPAIDQSILNGKFPEAKQIAFNTMVAQTVGYDFAAGRLDASAHPFTINFHPEDVRITTRYKTDSLVEALSGTIHEVGHGLYEQGLLAEHFGTPLGESISLGIHESQSRVWENQIGKSQAFWTYFYPKLQRTFPKPFTSVDKADFYRALNAVHLTPIRVEADEVTYNLHIIIRFEIERDLMEGRLEVADLPKVWNQKYKEYLDIDIKNDAEGVLQDVHWSHGSIGYFPTYTLGNLYAAQFFVTARQQLPDLDAQLAAGQFTPIRDWLKTNIHVHGKAFTASALVKHVTGEPLSAQFFTDYLQQKYSDLYDIT